MSELKPCPFCGGEARFKVWGNVAGVECDRCGIGTHTACIDEYQNAIDAWNTRAERTCKNVHKPPKATTFWPSPHFKCSECGCVHVSMDYVYYCPNCGAKVIDDD